MKFTQLLAVAALCTACFTSLFATETPTPQNLPAGQNLYVIERTIPGAGALTAEQLKGISQTSCGVLKDLGPSIQWVQSYVTGDKVFCVYLSPNEEMIREHAKRGGFPVDSVNKVATVIGPKTAE